MKESTEKRAKLTYIDVTVELNGSVHGGSCKFLCQYFQNVDIHGLFYVNIVILRHTKTVKIVDTHFEFRF